MMAERGRNLMRVQRLVAALGVLAATAGTVVALATPALANTTLCDQYASTTIDNGAYIVQNNRWGTSATQCLDVSSTGFTMTKQEGVNPTNGAPTSYPSAYWGCHYGNCTTGFSPIPANSSTFTGLRTSTSMSYPAGGNWDAAYDIWFDPTARTNGQNTGAEIMVWLNHSGPPQPIGSKVATVSLAGGTWDVWEGNVGWNVVSYVRTAGTGSASFAVSTFFDDALARGYASRSWYLTSVQAGFEPWSGGAGLAVNSFSVTNGTGSDTVATTPAATASPTPSRTPTSTPTTTAGKTPTSAPTTTATVPETGSNLGCSASFAITQSWSGGFIGEVTVHNTSTSKRSTRWQVSWTWPGAQNVSSMWNATAGGSGRTETATAVNYNQELAPGSVAAFGFVSTGTAATPTLSCTAS
jgi:hypothetical protein